jgi:tetratricopeptide (TPR) repeat protein
VNDVNQKTRQTDGIRRDIEDNYPEYPEDEYGYTYDAWDLLTLEETDRHDELITSSPEVLESLDTDELDDLERLAVARASRRIGETDRFITTCREMLESESRHPAIVYPEIAIFAGRELASDDKPRALAWLDEFYERAQELMEGRILRAVLQTLVSDESELMDSIIEEYGDEAEMYYEVAEEFDRQGDTDAARSWLEQAREKANATGDRATLIDVDLLARELPESTTPHD